MQVDVIILSNTVSKQHLDMLLDTVFSLRDSETIFDFNINIIESNKDFYQLLDQHDIKIDANIEIPKQKFNYNLFLNKGLRKCKNEYVLISNSDVIYNKDFFSEIYKQFKRDKELYCVCPIDRKWERHQEHIFPSEKEIYYGYRTSFEFTGWSFVVKREIFKKIGCFDERFEFYYQDNDFVALLELNKLKNGLATKSHIHHLLSKSHNTIKSSDRHLCNMAFQHKVFSNKWTSAESKEYKRLSLLICTLPERKQFLDRLISRLKPQITPEVEVLISDSGKEISIGKKRNELITSAKGEYIAFIDDDDWVSEQYVEKILKATDYKPDVVGFNSIISFDQNTPRRVEITLNHTEWSHKMGKIKGEEHPIIYYRCPNHLSPVKRIIAKSIIFPEINNQEDKIYSLALKEKCKDEIYIDDYMYFYDNRSDKSNDYSNYKSDNLIKYMGQYEKQLIKLADSFIKNNA